MAGDMYLENLEEFIFDEDRIVTYKWLSQTLSVHVNQAKQMLETFVKQLQQKPHSRAVNITYLLSGVQDADNGVKVNKVVLVSDKDVQKTEEAMTQLFSKHVYSVQKAMLKDANSLYMTDYQIMKENIKQPNRYSSIKCLEAKPRTPEELTALSSQSSYPTADTDSRPKPKMNGTAEKHVIESLKQEPPPKGTASKAKKSQITSFGGFSTGTGNKGSSERVEEKVASSSRQKERETSNTKQTSSKAKGGMMAFLNRPSTVKPKEEPKPKGPSTVKPKEEPKGPSTVKPKQEPKVSPPKQSSTVTATTKDARETRKESRPAGKVKRKAAKIEVSDSDSEGEKQSSKRRRRIIKQVSSSSSEDEVSDMEDSPIPPTPPPEPVRTIASESEDEGVAKRSSHMPSVVEESAPGSSGKRRRKKRVLRNKTSIDEDGCMVTEKVVESDWTDVSDNEAPPPKKATPPKTSQQGGAKTQLEEENKKKKTSPGSGGSGKAKQRSLMSFFKKK